MMQDIRQLGLPVAVVIGMLGIAATIGMQVQSRIGAVDTSSSQLAELKLQVQNLSAQVTQISVALAKGPTMPENVAFKADLLRFCVLNRSLNCPQF